MGHIRRLTIELDALNEKLTKLSAFFGTDTFSNLSDAEKYLLQEQERIMFKYAAILEIRLTLAEALAPSEDCEA